jgi:hypothetical protein
MTYVQVRRAGFMAVGSSKTGEQVSVGDAVSTRFRGGTLKGKEANFVTRVFPLEL